MKPFKHPLLEYLQDKSFVLASTSPRRLEIIQSLKIPNVEVVDSNFEENLDKSAHTPGEYVLETALGKANAAWADLSSQGRTPDVLLSADTVVECNGRIFEKPKSIEDNIASIKYIRDCGVVQRVLTGIIVFVKSEESDTGYKVSKHLEVTYIDMDTELTDEFIELYCNTEEGMGVAGGYRIQGFGSLFMKEIRGDFYNVVGLPFRSTFKLLEQALNKSL